MAKGGKRMDGRTRLRAGLLGWYDAHARRLPWRIPPGSTETPDPYRVWLSEVMLQQTSVAAVIGYFNAFTARWPTVAALAAAADEDVMAMWAGLGYYARARNLVACAREVARRGAFPDSVEGLMELPGIGPYTAAAIGAIAFGREVTPVDGNIERVTARLMAIAEPMPASKPAIIAAARALFDGGGRPGDTAQALMDLGATICTPKAPDCARCPVSEHCRAFADGIAATLPARAAKAERPTRYGHAFVAFNAGRVLLRRRPAKGLLGGMLEPWGGTWTTSEAGPDWTDAPSSGAWAHCGAISHTFTHFHLELEVYAADIAVEVSTGQWVALGDVAQAGVPTVFRKAIDQAVRYADAGTGAASRSRTKRRS
jgi:A/G-specific adenine glycosylase